MSATDHHKDPGVVFSSDLSFTAHYQMIASRAYRTLGLLRRTFSSKSHVREKRLLYITLVRSQLVYCSSVWRPFLIKDIQFLEKVQRRATKYVLGDFNSDYKSRLIALDLLPLMYILELNDVMFCIRSLKSPNRAFNIKQFIQFSNYGTRSSTAMRMSHVFTTTNVARHVFLNRIPRLWNSLPPINIDRSIASIRKSIETFLHSLQLKK